MKIYRNFGRYSVLSISPKEKFSKSVWGSKIMKETGGLSYLWNTSQIIPTQKFGKLSKREYKTHKNGHGILLYKCKQCNKPLDDISVRGVTPKLCESCKSENHKIREKERYRNRKNAET